MHFERMFQNGLSSLYFIVHFDNWPSSAVTEKIDLKLSLYSCFRDTNIVKELLYLEDIFIFRNMKSAGHVLCFIFSHKKVIS